MSIIQTKVTLAPFTSLGVGGPAEQLAELSSAQNVSQLPSELVANSTVLGYGANVLVSDSGLPGLTIVISNSHDQLVIGGDGVVTADAGHNWDELVAETVEQGWFGLEMMSGIPGGVGGAVIGNIAAYGQAVADSLQSIEVIDRQTNQLRTLQASELELGYRSSNLQTTNQQLIVSSATFKLSRQPLTKLEYQSALDAAEELGIKPDSPQSCRQIIMQARQKAGSLLEPSHKTAGSFFRNPLVTAEQAQAVIGFDETGRSQAQIEKMNARHGGDKLRVSAAHVLLAAGFKRGQSWGPVRLHPDHVLKIENTGGASAQQIYDVAQEIMTTAKQQLGITLQPEVKFLGEFSSANSKANF